MTSGLARFDAHCHLFNLKYLFLEAGDMLLDAVLGSYPHEGAPGEVVPGSIQQVTAKGKIRDFLRWLKGLEEACVGSEEEHLDAVLAAGRKSWGAPSHLAAIPLMAAWRALALALGGAQERRAAAPYASTPGGS